MSESKAFQNEIPKLVVDFSVRLRVVSKVEPLRTPSRSGHIDDLAERHGHEGQPLQLLGYLRLE